MNSNKRKYLFANKMHKTIFFLVLASSLLPALAVSISMYFLCFDVTADQLGMPETISCHLIPASHKVLMIMLLYMPALVLLILLLVYRITHQIIGPFDRIVRELRQCISGQKKGPIIIRKNDKFWPLVDNVNRLLEKYWELKQYEI